MFLDVYQTVFIFCRWFDLRDVVLTFLILLKKSSNHFKVIDAGLQISQPSKNVLQVILGTSVRYYIVLTTCFKGITHPIFCSDLVYKLQRITSDSKEKEEETRLSPMTKARTPAGKSKKQRDNTKTSRKTSITQRLRTDLGRSVGVILTTQLVRLNRFTGSQPSH